MITPRKKSPPLGGPAASPTMMKHAGSFIRKGGNLSILAVIALIFLFAIVMYSEDIKAIAQYSFSRSKAQENVPDVFSDPDPIHQSKFTTNSSNSSSQHKLPKSKKTTTTKPQKKDKTSSDSSKAQKFPNKATDTGGGGSGSGKLEPVVIKQEVFVGVPESCDLSQGYWVYDNVSRPLYREDQCEFMSQQVSCMQNGRKEDLYQKWRWQPIGCSLPKFNAKLMMERLRGKRLMFVGDSLNRNQWESMVCLLRTGTPPGKKHRRSEGSRLIYVAEDYNATVEFYWAPFLVESNSDNPKIHSIDKRIIKADSVEKHAKHWKDVDYLVFNTYIWWMNTLDMRVLRPGAKNWTEYDKILRGEAYERVLRTWSNWLEKNVDPERTKVFFMSMSPLHIQSRDWGDPNGIKCAKETLPIFNMTGVNIGTDMNMFAIAGKAARSSSRVPVTFVDITTMSDRRKDAHTSVYTVRQGALLTPEQQADPATYADCIHWCVPGLPDTWNEILYAYILSARSPQ